MRYVFRLPDVGEGIHEAEIIEYEVKVGDKIKADQMIIKIETDKAVVSLPAPVEGVVSEIPHKSGDTVAVGDPLIIIEAEKEVVEEVPEKAAVEEEEAAVAKPVRITAPARAEAVADKPIPPRRVLATPHTRHLARELGVDINAVVGSGSRGRVTDEHVQKAYKAVPPERPKIPSAAAVEHEASTKGFEFEKYGSTRRVPLKGVRKRIAEVMVRSFSTIPHVSHSDEADVTDLLDVVKNRNL